MLLHIVINNNKVLKPNMILNNKDTNDKKRTYAETNELSSFFAVHVFLMIETKL